MNGRPIHDGMLSKIHSCAHDKIFTKEFILGGQNKIKMRVFLS